MIKNAIIKKLKNGKYRLVSKKKDKSGKRRNLGTFTSLEEAKNHEREVEYFKHKDDDAADGENKDKSAKALSKMSDIAGFLEESGFIDAADKVYMAMDAVDGDLSEDYTLDAIPDNQLALPGSMDYMMTGEVAGGMQGAFSVPEAEKLAALANKLDENGFHEEADEIDEILKIIQELEAKTPKKRKEKDKEGVGVLVDSNGHVGTGVTDNQNAGSFQGFSDAYFYSGYGNLEGVYGPR